MRDAVLYRALWDLGPCPKQKNAWTPKKAAPTGKTCLWKHCGGTYEVVTGSCFTSRPQLLASVPRGQDPKSRILQRRG